MKHKNLLKIIFFMLFIFLTTFTLKAQTTGDIAFVAFNADGDDDFAIVVLKDIAASTTIYFSDNEPDGAGGINTGEGFLQWDTGGSIISAGTVVVFTDTDNAGNTNFGASTGTLSDVGSGTLNLSGSGDGLFAYVGTDESTPTTFLAGVANTTSTSVQGDLADAGLSIGSTFNIFTVSGTPDGGYYSASRTSEASFSDYLSLIGNTSNWTTETSNGENILPISTTSFSISGSPVAGITLGTVSGNTNESGTTATFTVVLNAQPTTDVVIDVSSGDTGEVTINAPTSLTFTNGNWDQTQTVTVSGVNDGDTDGNVDVTITVAVNDDSSDNDYDGISTSTTVTNEDDDLPNIVINEIMYNSPSTDDEWVELFNANGSDIDISDWTIVVNGGTFTFPSSTTFTDATYLVIAIGSNGDGSFNNDNPFTPDYSLIAGGIVADVATTNDTNHMANSSNSVTLKNSGGATIDIVNYSNADTDGDHNGEGETLELVDTSSDNSSTGSNWQSSGFNGGTPKGVNASYWTGATSTDWSIAGNWNALGVPSTSSNFVIPSGLSNYPVAASAITISQGLIKSGATLTAQSTFTGTVTYERTLGTTNWYLVSSPVSGETYDTDWIDASNIDDTNGTGNNVGIATFTTATSTWSYVQSGVSGNFSNGSGYSVKQNFASNLYFTGSINTQDVPVSVLDDDGGFNLIGSPYTTNLTSASFLTDNTGNLDSQTLWVWNQATEVYDAYVTGDNFILAPTQGFFIKASADASLNFAESYQTASTGTFQKSAKTEIKLFMSDGDSERISRINYLPNSTTGFDNGYDGETFGGIKNSFDVFTNLVKDNMGKKYQVQSLPNSEYESMVIPVGMTADADNEITFSAESLNLPSGIKVFLEDRETNTFTRLDEVGSEYTISLTEKVDGVGRFYLHTKSSVLNTSEISLNTISIYKSNASTLRITGLSQGKASVKLFNILGKQVINESFTSSSVKEIDLPNLSAGVYIVQLTTEIGQLNKKITLE